MASVTRDRTWWLVTGVLALVVFAYVQDRVTAAGARRYVAEQRMALDVGAPLVRPDQAMRPVIDRSVRAGVTAAAVVVGLSGLARLVALRRAGRAS